MVRRILVLLLVVGVLGKIGKVVAREKAPECEGTHFSVL